jgi:hypothetical protein
VNGTDIGYNLVRGRTPSTIGDIECRAECDLMHTGAITVPREAEPCKASNAVRPAASQLR